MAHIKSFDELALEGSAPLLSIEYRDRDENVRGYLVIDRLVGGVAAGGLRIQPGIDARELARLARNMTLKQAVAGIRVGGAKAGLNMSPHAPARDAVLRRFLAALKPLILHCYSCGPDVNTRMDELDSIARAIDIPSPKIAVGRSRGLDDREFCRRYALLSQTAPGGTVNELRAATAVAAAVRTLLEQLDAPPAVALQGAGTVGGATARLLHAAGIDIVAWADDQQCLVDRRGLNVPELLAHRSGGRLRPNGSEHSGPPAAILSQSCSVLVLAAVSDALCVADVERLRARGMVEAANLAVPADAGVALHRGGIPLIPDLIAGVGGSLAVEALYATAARDGRDVLRHVHARATALAQRVLRESRATSLAPRAVALSWIEETSATTTATASNAGEVVTTRR
ncbi:MAG TPA: Glu/Leu/Phe/Val dehydrogenase dimerization domain-containing protein [Burkholderiaceae bacterium]|nr:Glu/Leu/Phe/Val dehydrogenase dimerization domain-containing protein [Burkholderiaceae bacterium]